VAFLTPELAAQVVAATTTNAEEAAGALSRAFDGEFVVKAGEPGKFEPTGSDSISGGGLVFAFKFGEEQMLAALPAGTGLVPEWTKTPDPTGASKLSTLGQELSMLFLPDSMMADSFDGRWVEDLAAAIGRSEPAADATAAPIEIAQGESLATLTLVWPVANADAAFNAATSAASSAPATQPIAEPIAETPPLALAATPEVEKSQSKVLRWKQPAPRDLRDLPPNVLSALRVTVPVSVNLAGKKIKLEEVIDLGPGSIITFDKACDAPLEVSIGGRPVATGEAVKVGERFGVRVQKMILPEEHFRTMLPAKKA
jgi:flagellar motor switch/type III secretory pathway protein FliN